MADRESERPDGDQEEQNELLSSELDEEPSSSSSGPARLPRDHCDFLLDAIDAQLSQMQSASFRKQGHAGNSPSKSTEETSRAATFNRSQSLSKDAGLGSTIQPGDAPPSDPHMVCPMFQDPSSEPKGRRPDSAEEEREERETRRTQGGDSRKEQYRWRLEQLLGSQGAGEQGYESDVNMAESVCTEDFAAKFREGMVDPQVDPNGELGSDTSECLPEEPFAPRRLREGPTEDLQSGTEADDEQMVLGTPRGRDNAQQITQDSERGPTSEGLVKERCGLGRSRRDSEESLGGRISRTSQSNTSGKDRNLRISTPEPVSMSENRMSVIALQNGHVQSLPCLPAALDKETGREKTGFSPTRISEDLSLRMPSVSSLENHLSAQPIPADGKPSSLALDSHLSVGKDDERQAPGLSALGSNHSPGGRLIAIDPGVSTPPFGELGEMVKGALVQDQRHMAPYQGCGAQKAHQRSIRRSDSWPPTSGSSPGTEVNEASDTGRSILLPKASEHPDTAADLQRWGQRAPVASLLPPAMSVSYETGHMGTGSPISQNEAAEEQYGLSQTPNSGVDSTVSPSVAGFHNTSRKTLGSQCSLHTVGTEEYVGTFPTLPVKHVAGVPVKNFDEVTIDSDLDSVNTARVRKHVQSALHNSKGTRPSKSLVVEDLYTDQSDLDAAKPEAIQRTFHSLFRKKKTLSQGGRRASTNRSSARRPGRRSHHGRKEASRYASSDKTPSEEEEEGCTGVQAALEWSPSRALRWDESPQRRETRAKGLDLSHESRLWLDEMSSDRLVLEESLSRLRKQDLVKEEERLLQKRAQQLEADQSLSALLQQKKQALRELESVRGAVERGEREASVLEARLRDSRSQVDETRSQLLMLEYQRESCLKEGRALEEQLSTLRGQCSPPQSRQAGALQDRVAALSAERDELRARLRHSEGSLTLLERQELERQLGSAKSELFAEQRRARERADALQEKLEECQTELEQRADEALALQGRCSRLEEQLREKEALARERGERAAALERILAEKELEMLRLREAQAALQAAADGLREQHRGEQQRLQQDAARERDHDLQQLKEELNAAHSLEMQQVLQQAEEDRLAALNTQALCFTQDTEQLQHRLQLKQDEVMKLKDALQLQEESMKQLSEELKEEAKVMVAGAVAQQREEWEAQKAEELQRQRGMLEDEARRAVESATEERERERRNALSLQNKVVELQTGLQELECEKKVQQREQQAALSTVRSALRQEQQEEILRLRQDMEQERQRELERARAALEQAQRESQQLRAALGAAAQREEDALAQAERQRRSWALDLGAECQRLQELLSRRGPSRGPADRLHSSCPQSVPQAVQALSRVSEQLHSHIGRLHQDLETQRHAVQHVTREKERELRQQREELGLEKERALDSLRERLIQEHIEEVSQLQRVQLKESAAADSQALRQQLREKNNELRAIQRSMGQWKEQTAAKLARKFEEELSSELERCKTELLKERRGSRNRYDQHKKLLQLESEMKRLSTECADAGHLRSASSPSLCASASAAPAQPDLGSLKLLRHLQSRVKQLRAENSLLPGRGLAGSDQEPIQNTPDRPQHRFNS
ncbi:rootletin isoform X3 [Lepisosteus oculatus]|uniref:rootletin isoform X3 n=1 Tax=Lepisosteus oculatus TaxID=7918 RepID=UPI0035F50351